MHITQCYFITKCPVHAAEPAIENLKHNNLTGQDVCVLNLNESTFAVHFRVRHKIRGLLIFNVPEKNKSSAAAL